MSSNEQRPVGHSQLEAMRRTPHRDIELMPQIQILDFKPPPRLESVGNENNEQVQWGEHCDEACVDSHSNCQPERMEFSGTTIGTRSD